jgi:ADP-heptose:LPS heptosyltransferase
MRPFNQIERVLVYRLGSLGDTVMALPALHLIRERFPKAEITILTNAPVHQKAPPLASIVENTNLCQQVMSYPLRLRSVQSLRRLRNEIATRRFQLAIHLAESRGWLKSLRDHLFFQACGIGRIVGIPSRRRDLFCQPLAGRYEWEAQRLIRRLAPPGEIDLQADKWWDLHFTAPELARADELLAGIPRPFLAASLGTKKDVNDWTEPNWHSLLGKIGAQWPELGLALLGSEDERAGSERCSQGWPGLRLNLCGRTAPRISAAVLRQARLFIGHDSGPMHLAGAVGTPCIAIFSAKGLHGQWFPRGRRNTIIHHQTECAGCGLEVCVHHAKKCILSITVDEVMQAVGKHLSRHAENPAATTAASINSLAVLPAI